MKPLQVHLMEKKLNRHQRNQYIGAPNLKTFSFLVCPEINKQFQYFICLSESFWMNHKNTENLWRNSFWQHKHRNTKQYLWYLKFVHSILFLPLPTTIYQTYQLTSLSRLKNIRRNKFLLYIQTIFVKKIIKKVSRKNVEPFKTVAQFATNYQVSNFIKYNVRG